MQITQVLALQTYRDAMSRWPWVDFGSLEPKFNSLFGAIFLAAGDGSIWYFDPIEGVLERPWANRGELVATLGTPAGEDEYLLGGLAFAAAERVVELKPGKIYIWAPHPAIGGFAVAQLMTMDFALAHDIYAQYRQPPTP